MNTKNIGSINILQFELFSQSETLHFTTTRQGGISKESYESLNLGNLSDDNIESVTENRKRLCQTINISLNNLFVPHQTHGVECLIINSHFLSLSEEEQKRNMQGIDALITQEKNICIAITTADCVPILIFDQQKKVFATIHAGWKGTVGNIVGNTINKMKAKFGSDPQYIIAGIGPSISPQYFEVGDEVGIAFEQAGFDLNVISYRNPNTGKLHIDLWKANQVSLINSGILDKNIELAEICNYSNPELFFSARRQTIHSGRMLTGGIII